MISTKWSVLVAEMALRSCLSLLFIRVAEPVEADVPESQFNKNQVIVMVGETGSGKTTQYAQSFSLLTYSRLPVSFLRQDTTICFLLRSSTRQEQSRRMYAASTSRCHVRRQTGCR
jgi:ABC-type glutathione transport system ATPase component